jgi:hypothetical protein
MISTVTIYTKAITHNLEPATPLKVDDDNEEDPDRWQWWPRRQGDGDVVGDGILSIHANKNLSKKNINKSLEISKAPIHLLGSGGLPWLAPFHSLLEEHFALLDAAWWWQVADLLWKSASILTVPSSSSVVLVPCLSVPIRAFVEGGLLSHKQWETTNKQQATWITSNRTTTT